MIGTQPSRIGDADLAELWFGFRRRTWRKVVDAVKSIGIDQKILAARIGMDPGQFSKAVSGRSNVTLRTLHNIARAAGHRLDVSLTPLNTLPKPNYRFERPPTNHTLTKESRSEALGGWTCEPAAHSLELA